MSVGDFAAAGLRAQRLMSVLVPTVTAGRTPFGTLVVHSFPFALVWISEENKTKLEEIFEIPDLKKLLMVRDLLCSAVMLHASKLRVNVPVTELTALCLVQH